MGRVIGKGGGGSGGVCGQRGEGWFRYWFRWLGSWRWSYRSRWRDTDTRMRIGIRVQLLFRFDIQVFLCCRAQRLNKPVTFQSIGFGELCRKTYASMRSGFKMAYASNTFLHVLRMSLLGSWIVALMMLSISPWRTPLTNSSGSHVFKQAKAASAVANRMATDLSLMELRRYVRIPGNLVDPMISMTHAFPRAEKTLFERMHCDRRAGKKTGTSGANDDWSD